MRIKTGGEYGQIPLGNSENPDKNKTPINILTPKASSKCGWQRRLAPLALAAAAVMGTGIPAEAANLKFRYNEGTTYDQIVGFEMAGRIWEEVLADDDLTVNIDVNLQDFGYLGKEYEGVIGLADPDRNNYLASELSVVNGQLQKTTNDSGTSSIGNYEMIIDGTTGKEVVTSNEVTLTSANAKALGLIADSESIDGIISLNNNIVNQGQDYDWNYDFTRQNNVGEREFDFLSVALHEIGHALGFTSGIDGDGELASNNEGGSATPTPTASALDIFRYSEESASQGIIDMSVDTEKRFFSTDGGQTEIAEFSTGLENIGGDGYQASHWKDGEGANSSGIMDPATRVGERGEISALDLEAFGAIGWNLSGTTWQDLNLESLKQEAEERAAEAIFEDVLFNNDNASGSYHWWGYVPFFWYWQQASFATIDDSYISQRPVSVPEPGSTMALLGLGLAGIVSMLKGRSKK